MNGIVTVNISSFTLGTLGQVIDACIIFSFNDSDKLLPAVYSSRKGLQGKAFISKGQGVNALLIYIQFFKMMQDLSQFCT